MSKAPWERPRSHFWEPVSKAYDHQSRDPLSGRSHQRISRERAVYEKGQCHAAWNYRKEESGLSLLLRKEERKMKDKLGHMLY